MSETTIAEPLSGYEISVAVQSEVDRVLARDCRLNAALAYPSFRCRVWVELDIADGGDGVRVEAEAVAHGGPQDLLKDVVRREAHSELKERPPNVVRQEAGLPIPTLVEEPSGRKEVRPVKYAKKTEEPGRSA